MPRAQRRCRARNGPTILLAVALLGACVAIFLLMLVWSANKECPTSSPEIFQAATQDIWV